MAEPDALLRDGDLAGARAALVEIVKARPADQQARMFLFQLLAVAGEWDKARNQLQALAGLEAEAQMLSVTYNQAIEAERQRAAVFGGSAEMVLLAGADGWAEGVASSIGMRARGEHDAADAARDEAFDAAPEMPGTIDGEPFDWIADADGRFGPTFECILGGRYGLMPFDEVTGITSEGPRDLRDTVWYPVEIMFRNGQSAAAFLPARYPGTETSDNDALKLARKTDWVDGPGGERGLGQRLFVVSGGEDKPLLGLRSLTFTFG